MKKKLLTITMSLIFVLALVGCGNKTTDNGVTDLDGADMPNNSYQDEIAEQDEMTTDCEAVNPDDKDKFKDYTQNLDGTWECEGNTYKYKLEITGRMNNATCDTTFVYLSNIEEITFEQAWKGSGLSSDMNDYFDVKDAVLVMWQNNKE